MDGKKIWIRLGVTVPVTEDELFNIMEEAHQSVSSPFTWFTPRSYDLTEEESAKFLKRAVAGGDNYIPNACFDEHIDWWLRERERRNQNEKES